MTVKKFFLVMLFSCVYLLLFALDIGCHFKEKQRSLVKTKEEYIILSDNCKISSTYAAINGEDSMINSLNNSLRYINQFGEFSKYCNHGNIIGSYSILLESDSLICLEYVVSIPESNRTVFRPVFISTKKNVLLEPNTVVHISDTRTLLPYVKKFCDSAKVDINLSVYEKNNAFAITYGITPHHLILYLGGEGELYGKYRVRVPMSELQKYWK